MTGAYFSVKPDYWLSDKLGLSAFSISCSTDGQAIDQIKGNILSTPNIFASLKVPATDPDLSCLLQRNGFLHVETSLAFQRPAIPSSDSSLLIRAALPSDQIAVAAIARRSFVYSRFHQDPMIPDVHAYEIKAEWVNNFFSGGRGDGLLVAELKDQVVGFLLYIVQPNQPVIIDLIAVNPDATRKGIGAALIDHLSSSWHDAQHPVTLHAGTQANNIPAINLYIKKGFRLINAQHVFHYHSNSKHDGALEAII